MMKVVKHTQISLTVAECSKIIAEHLSNLGIKVHPSEVEALIDHGDGCYSLPKFNGFIVKCQYVEEDK